MSRPGSPGKPSAAANVRAVTTPTEDAVEAPPDGARPGERTRPTGRFRGRRRLLSWVSIQSKLLLMLLLTSVLSAAIVAAIGYQSGRASLRAAAFDRLTEIREAQTRFAYGSFKDLQNSLVVYTRGSTTINAMREFTRGFNELNDDPAKYTVTPQQQQQIEKYYRTQFAPQVEKESGLDLDLQGLLPQSNAQRYLQAIYTAPFTTDNYSIDVDDAHDGSTWTAAHAKYNDFFREIVHRFEYDDALLIDPRGNVVYSAYKGVDLGTNIMTGPYHDSDLAQAFNKAMAANTVDYVVTTDFAAYLPSYNDPTTHLITTPIETITSTGIRTADGVERDVDLIVTATGYELWTDPETYRPGTITGTDGFDLAEDYRMHGLRSFAGTAHPDLPNRWEIVGPEGFVGVGWTDYVEMTADHAVRVIDRARRAGPDVVAAVSDQAFEAYHLRMQRNGKTAHLYFTRCNDGINTYFVNSQGDTVYHRPQTIFGARRLARDGLQHYHFGAWPRTATPSIPTQVRSS